MKMSVCRSVLYRMAVALGLAMGVGVLPLQAQMVTINVHTNEPHPLHQDFSGFNMNLFNNGTSYLDPAMTRLAEKVSPGWIRFPAGTADDDFDWKTGLTPPSMLNFWQGSFLYGTFQQDAKILAGKSDAAGLPGLQIADHLTFVKNLSRALGYPVQTIGVINTFTDTPQSAADIVKWAKDHKLSVPIWELGNEPQNLGRKYPSVQSYLSQVQSYATAIHGVDPKEKVAVFAGYGTTVDNWIQALENYPAQHGGSAYWNDFYYHTYPCNGYPQQGPAMECLNYYLNQKSAHLMDPSGYYGATIGATNPNFKIEASELNVSSGNIMAGTLYSGIFDAEYIMRLSQSPHVQYAGIHVLVCPQPGAHSIYNFDCIIVPTQGHTQDVLNAYNLGKTINTANLNFGYFLSATGVAMEVANPAINRSTHTWTTSITGGPSVGAYDKSFNYGNGQIPAIFALGYEKTFPNVHRRARDWDSVHDDSGRRMLSHREEHQRPQHDWNTRSSIHHKGYLLITNKSGVASKATIEIDGKPLRGAMHLYFVSSSNPEVRNTPLDTNAVEMQKAVSRNPITIPPYSIMRIDF